MTHLQDVLDQVMGAAPVPQIDFSGLEEASEQVSSHSELISLLMSFCERNTIPFDELVWWIETYYEGNATRGISGLVTDLYTSELRLLDVLENLVVRWQASSEGLAQEWILQNELDLLDPEIRLALTQEIITQYDSLLPHQLTNLSIEILSLHLEDLIHSIIYLRQSPYAHINLNKL